VVFALSLTGLIVLFKLSETRRGIISQISSNHYSSTYGPTALLLVVVGSWQRIVYYCKILAPWKELYNNESRPQRNLLLDNVPPTLPTALLRAYRNKHWTVGSSILGLMLLRITLIFSTGLLVLTTTEMTDEEMQVHTDSVFVGSNAAQGRFELTLFFLTMIYLTAA
jgi:hypothetical protein